ncbi:MAG: hypothetical protein R3362_08190, partial [Rhodothermales bacterium]|nr:hypothetical protein [Rhodothermales bacterium]
MRLRPCPFATARALLAGPALLVGLAATAPARAQVSVAPDTVRVTLPAGQATEAALTVVNGGAEPRALALSLAPVP